MKAFFFVLGIVFGVSLTLLAVGGTSENQGFLIVGLSGLVFSSLLMVSVPRVKDIIKFVHLRREQRAYDEMKKIKPLQGM